VTARARTLAVLSQLDGKCKRTVLLFLREARLINTQWHIREGRTIYPRIVGLRNADLSNAHLRAIQLISTDRQEAVSLEGAILRGADLRGADLERADLRGTDLSGADLRHADLSGVDLDVPQETEKLTDLSGANLSDANLSGANLRGAKSVTKEKLQFQAKALKGAIMPDGTVHD
jgi:uncharacterized protein YjbI with pentapeptide repeats